MRMPHALSSFFAVLAVCRGGCRGWGGELPRDMFAEGATTRGGSQPLQPRGQAGRVLAEWRPDRVIVGRAAVLLPGHQVEEKCRMPVLAHPKRMRVARLHLPTVSSPRFVLLKCQSTHPV